ncbi:MAG: hypothetical protein PVG30_06250 [Gammaproteobacteria bacterium]|jgi:hypothetical protein
MFKKSILVAAASAAFIGISGVCSAASFTGWDQAVMPPSARQHADYRYPYIRIGAGAYDFNNEKFEVGTVGNTTAPLAKIDSSKVTPFYNLAVGYAFYNPRENIVTKIFGHDNAVELQLDYFNFTRKTSNSNLGTGRIWYIDGSGVVIPFAEPLQNFQLNAKHRYINAGLYYRGGWITSNPKITFMPRAGAVITNLNEKYDYTVQYMAGGTSFRTDKEEYKADTYYYGLAGGGRLQYSVQPQFAVFGDLEAQLLYVSSKLNADQNIAIEATPSAAVTPIQNKHSQVTYRAILAVGAQYKINRKITSPSIEAKIGVDRWGYDPRVVPSNNANSGPVHLASDQRVNYFANIGVTVPIG